MNHRRIALEELLAHDAWIRALARRLLAGEHDAEDLAQEAWLAATVDPPRPTVPLRAWLVRVARNLRAMRHRSETTRRRHERAAARPETLPSVAEMQERQEQCGQVARAVFSLEEPYRSAILYRYFQDMPPREIARQLGLSAAAVETRLRRGLEQLRARLDRDFGDRRTWHQALVTWIGASVVDGAATGAATASGTSPLSLSGALLMSTKIKVAAATTLLAAVGLVTLLLFHRNEPDRGLDAPTPEAATTVEHASMERSTLDPGPVPGSATSETRDSAPASAKPATPGSRLLRGRCVSEEDGHPLAGCQVQLELVDTRDFLFGRVPRSEESRLLSRGPANWTPPAQVSTESDGRFTLRFDPPPDGPIALRVRAANRATMQHVWKHLPAVAETDLGDLPMAPGVRVTGRIVDASGTSQPGVRLSLVRIRSGAAPRFGPLRSVRVVSQADGTFAVPEPVAPGPWQPRPFGRTLARPSRITLPVHPSETAVRVVLVDRDAITGIVTDEQGRPVPGVRIAFDPDRTTPLPFFTGPDGSFHLERGDREPTTPVRLWFEKDGFEPYSTSGPVAWTTAGLRITMQRGCPMTLRVLDRSTGKPVERYGVRCFPVPGSSLDPDRGRQLRCAGFHDTGILILDSVRRGKNVVLVEPLGDVYAPSTFHEVTVPVPGSTEVVVRVSRLVTRTVRVKRSDGSPVNGTRVQLVRSPLHGTVGLDSRVGHSSLFRSCYPFDEIVLLLDEGATGARGTLAMQGPSDERIALRVLGPGHPPFVVQDVVLGPANDVLDVVVPTGGTLTGTLGPDDVLRRLAPGKNAVGRSREKYDPAARAAFLDKHRPGIRLIRHGHDPIATGQAGHEDKILLDAGGRFRVEGIEPGSWDVYFAFSLDSRVSVWSSFHNQLLATVRDLRAGETRHLELDLSHLRTGTLTGCVFHRGRPLADHGITFQGSRIDARGRTVRVIGRSARTDPRGRFTVELFPGRYRASASFAQVGKTHGTRIQSPEEAEVVVGGRIICDFHLTGTRLTIRVVAPDGETPVADMRLFVHFLSNRTRIRPAPTNAAGEVTLDPVPPGRIELRAFPRGFESTRARRDSLRKGRRVKTFSVGAIEVPAGEAQVTRTIVLPLESGY